MFHACVNGMAYGEYGYLSVCVWYVIRCLFMAVITMQKKEKKIFFLSFFVLLFCRAIAILPSFFNGPIYLFFR